jgi:prephenate dehydrogenase
MAGSHRVGPLTARADLFEDRTWVIATHPAVSAHALTTVRQLAEVCGARIEVMDALEHDRAVAEVSHVPQILSSLMAGNLTGIAPAHLRLAGQGVRDVTRIAGSNQAMWTSIILANQQAISEQLTQLANALDAVRNNLHSPQAVADFLRLGVEGTRVLPGKHGLAPTDYVYVVVEIPDSPGSLARLFAEIDAGGFNVEDLAIEHDQTRHVGYMSIAVEADQAAALGQAIAQGGWTLRS